MTDTENKTEKTKETPATDTAPYMKKTSQSESKAASNKTEMLVPAVLLLISAIVIGATFYGNKNTGATDTLAQEEDTPAATAITEVETITEVPASDTGTTNNTDTTQQQSAANTETDKTTTAEESTAKADTSEQKLAADSEEAPAVAEVIIVTEEKVAAAPQTLPASQLAAAHPAHVIARAPYQYNPYNRQQAQARAKQHMEMLRQRRQAYEREMQDRHAQYEAAMKAQQAKRAKIAEAEKAVFQRAQKDRLMLNQKIEKIHKQIAELHEEIHQLMNEYRINNAPVPMHSM